MATAMIVCCYGNYDPHLRTAAEMDGYYWYLRGIEALITGHQPECVVLCGGHTEPNADQSEAASVLPMLRTSSASGPMFLLEERGLNTPGNLQFGFDQVIERGEPLDELIVVCDHVRRWKVRVLMWKLTSVEHKVIGVHRPDTHPNSTRHRQLAETIRYLFQPTPRIFT